MIYNINDYVIGRSVKEYGEWCQGEIDILKEIIKPGMTVLDVGANIGTHALAFSYMVGSKGKVLAFEPQRHIFHILAGNVAINSIQNIWCYYNAVSDEHVIIKVKQLDFEVLLNTYILIIPAHNKYGRGNSRIDLKAAPTTPANAAKEPQPAEWAEEEAYQRLHKFTPNFGNRLRLRYRICTV